RLCQPNAVREKLAGGTDEKIRLNAPVMGYAFQGQAHLKSGMLNRFQLLGTLLPVERLGQA
ncbi:MAG: hypothetical protein VB032_05170, partial [Burkholderiaceae bacterium]|nr:hypothetical protein [Burkholderiaceae bacterium]